MCPKLHTYLIATDNLLAYQKIVAIFTSVNTEYYQSLFNYFAFFW